MFLTILGVVPNCNEIIFEGKPVVTSCILGVIAYPLLTYIMKEFTSGGKNGEEQFLGFWVSSAIMVIDCVFNTGKHDLVALEVHANYPRWFDICYTFVFHSS